MLKAICSIFKTLVLTALLLSNATVSHAQFALKTNILGWGLTNPNLGIEYAVSNKSTLQAIAYVNPWKFGHNKDYFRFWMVQPEYRYWFCEKYNGWFFGAHLLGGEYSAKGINFPLKSLVWGNSFDNNPEFDVTDHTSGWPNLRGENYGRHAEGWYAGAGISAGYHWPLSRHWNLEASLGVGYVYSQLRYYGRCRQRIDKRNLNYVGPTNAQISILYLF